MIEVGSRVVFVDGPSNIRIYLPEGALGTVTEIKVQPTGWQLRSRGITGFIRYVVRFDARPDDPENVDSYEVRELTALERLAYET